MLVTLLVVMGGVWWARDDAPAGEPAVAGAAAERERHSGGSSDSAGADAGHAGDEKANDPA
ncbi:hypothetical protein GUY61_23165, partial [Streptomyces sp. GC420]|nr:hypothetical protein [Streptomyces sp. GC420]